MAGSLMCSGSGGAESKGASVEGRDSKEAEATEDSSRDAGAS